MSDVDIVVLMFELHLESERVVEASPLPLHRVLIVANVLAFSVPADPAGPRSILARVEERLLALVVRAVGLYQVDYVEFVSCVFPHIGHLEVEPLCVVGRLEVVLQDQVVRVVAHVDGSS